MLVSRGGRPGGNAASFSIGAELRLGVNSQANAGKHCRNVLNLSQGRMGFLRLRKAVKNGPQLAHGVRFLKRTVTRLEEQTAEGAGLAQPTRAGQPHGGKVAQGANGLFIEFPKGVTHL